MSKRRISRTQRKTHKTGNLRQSGSLKFRRYVGICLGGGKSDRTALAVLDHYPNADKLLLTNLYEGIEGDEKNSGDTVLLDLVSSINENLAHIAWDVPTAVPLCFSCKKKCPGVEVCKEPHIEWMWDAFKKRRRENKNARLFTPYTERAIESHLLTELEEPFFLQSALGANMAPLTARAQFLLRRLPKDKVIEVLPELSFWRIGKTMEVAGLRRPRQSRDYEEDDLRLRWVMELVKEWPLFMYQQDIQRMVDNVYALDAFLCAATAFLKDRGLTEKRPKGFPKAEAWPEFPVKNLKV